jgi:hypothetical protein
MFGGKWIVMMTDLHTDLHAAPRTEVRDRQQTNLALFALLELQRSRTEIWRSLHVRPTSLSMSGAQTTDLLGLLGFRRSPCVLLQTECYAYSVAHSFDLAGFAHAFTLAFDAFKQADKSLEACGIFLPHPENWGFFNGRPSEPRPSPLRGAAGDGHTAEKSERMKLAQDEEFQYAFSWIDGANDKGWTTHYRPLHPPLSSEMASAFQFLKFQSYEDCPEFDFEPCSWRFTPFEERKDTIFGSNAEIANRWFEAHPQQFSLGLQQLLAGQLAVRPFGMAFLPRPHRATTTTSTPSLLSSSPSPLLEVNAVPQYEYDVAISFAGTERALAEKLATLVRSAGMRVFYDAFYEEQLWGKDLAVFFSKVFQSKARYCVILVSREYTERIWTNHERQHAVARALREKGKEYILPIKVDDSELAGVSPTLGYISLRNRSIESIAELLLQKLRS